MRTLKQIRLDFQWEHPILYCLILLVIVAVAFPTVIIGIMRFQSSLEYPYEFLQSADQISEIRLIDIEQDIELYLYYTDETPGILDAAGSERIVLTPDAHSAFLSAFASVPCHKWVNDPWPFIRGGTILISFLDGSREWICADGTFYQDLRSGEASMTRFYFDEEAFSALLRSYGYQ